MSKQQPLETSHGKSTHWAWLLPILALSPLSLAAKGCSSGVIGDDCPTLTDCTEGSAGEGAGTAGSGPSSADKSCGGLLGQRCSASEFCDYPSGAHCGAADQTGVCTPQPQACDLIYAPVCGCDGVTYGNACDANSQGVSVASQGECEGGSGGTGGGGTGGSGAGGAEICGGIAALECPKGEYCNTPESARCGAGDQAGTCAPIPEGCHKAYLPVCGCDGETYGNECLAAMAGVSVAAAGECKSPGGEACGEVGGCEKDEYCRFPPESKCGLADQPGVCTPLPGDIACDTNYSPVCGCDGKTYSNDCVANAAGASIAHEGECEEPTGNCGGLIGKTCDKGYFCDYPPEMLCGITDGPGTCTPVPQACRQNFDPVCGCDGKTYGNDCEANAQGISVAHAGACE